MTVVTKDRVSYRHIQYQSWQMKQIPHWISNFSQLLNFLTNYKGDNCVELIPNLVKNYNQIQSRSCLRVRILKNSRRICLTELTWETYEDHDDQTNRPNTQSVILKSLLLLIAGLKKPLPLGSQLSRPANPTQPNINYSCIISNCIFNKKFKSINFSNFSH